jgi:hypothetical protein
LEGLAKSIMLYLEELAKSILLYLEGLAKSDVVLQRGVLHPGLLGHIGHLALDIDLTGHAHPLHVPNERGE